MKTDAGTEHTRGLSESNNLSNNNDEMSTTTTTTKTGRRRTDALRGVMVESPVYPGTLHARRSIALHGAILGCLDSEKLVATIERRLRRLNAGGAQ